MTVTGRVHIIGAGLSGLSAAIACLDHALPVTLYEGAGQAGGRCRSFFDRTLNRQIDNGNHFILSANRAARAYLKRIGADDQMTAPAFANFPFVDVKSGERWTLKFNEGPIPFWLFDSRSRIPGTTVSDYLGGLKIAMAGADKTVSEALGLGENAADDLVFKRLWEPMTLAVLNTTPAIGSARLLWAALRESFALGGQACIPMTARDGLGTAFVSPALRVLEAAGETVIFGMRLRNLVRENGRITALEFTNETVPVSSDDQVILALPPSRLRQVMPELDPPGDDASILNVHFKAPEALPRAALGDGFFLGMLESDAQWAVIHDDIVSLTVSASHAIGMDEVPNPDVAERLWKETRIALGLGDMRFDEVRVIREKRATFDQSPAGAAKRLEPVTAHSNLFLAGDHTKTGLPATIEGSIRSGNRAGDLAFRQISAGGRAGRAA